MSSEGVRFWLDNKSVVGVPVASQGDQTLVGYHGRYYLLVDGIAQKKAGKTLRYSHTSLPPAWKKTINGSIATTTPDAVPSRQQVSEKKAAPLKDPREDTMMEEPTAAPAAAPPVEKKAKSTRSAKKQAENAPPAPVSPATDQVVATVECPYCKEQQDIFVEHGKIGRAFIQGCAGCHEDFALRLVPVTTYQVQVAGFR